MNSFVWADLSTYDPEKSKRFYETVFGWQFHDDQGYSVAMNGRRELTGLFETPEFFQKIKMPHFWMSYIAVKDALNTAEIASGIQNAKVERTTEFYGGQIALIRDPQGAGFTIYDGGKLNSRASERRRVEHGDFIWNELHVSDATEVIPFYERLFDWKITAGANSSGWVIHDSMNKHIADLHEIPNEIKGKYEYWVCTFAVKDLAETRQKIEQSGGGCFLDEEHRIMMHDDSGEAFFYIQALN